MTTMHFFVPDSWLEVPSGALHFIEIFYLPFADLQHELFVFHNSPPDVRWTYGRISVKCSMMIRDN